MLEQYDEVLTFEDVRKIIKVSRPVLTRMLKQQELKGMKLSGSTWRIMKQDLIELLQQKG